MKTAISLPDEVFEAADDLAEELGVSRSSLYAQAMVEFLARHRGDYITDKLNEVYGAEPAEVDETLADLQSRSLPEEKW